MSSDPFEVLGVAPTASLQELAAARRQLAQAHHPDLGGDVAAMQAVNAAYEQAVELRRHAPPISPPADTTVPKPSPPGAGRRSAVRGVQYDAPSFTIDVLPVEAFEALLIVTSWIGEVLVDDPPYVLEVFLNDPSPCWCRLDLVPDAGATTVSLTVAAVEGEPAPDIDAVRDVWVANLNQPLW